MQKLTESAAIEILVAAGRDWKPVPGHGEGCIEAQGFHTRLTISPDADGMFDRHAIEAFIERDTRKKRLSPQLEAAWARVEAGGDPTIELANVVMTAADEDEIEARCEALADKLEAEAAAHEQHAAELHSHRIARHVDRTEGNVTHLRRSK